MTEKLDGSQFAFGVLDGDLHYRSKGRQIPVGSVQENDLFYPATQYVEYLFSLGALPEGVIFYGETLAKPKHNTLAYDRIPKNHIALFSAVDVATSVWLPYSHMVRTADMLEVDVVQPIFFKMPPNAEDILAYLEQQPVSMLGGQPMEGVVVKDYSREMLYGGVAMPFMCAKYVSEKFKEVHQKSWKSENTGKGKWEVFQERYRTEARWMKAVQHLRERGELTGTPKDIGPLIFEAQRDIKEECQQEIMVALWNMYGKDLIRNATKGLPEWFKEELAKGNINV